jgi:hypothetical protein
MQGEPTYGEQRIQHEEHAKRHRLASEYPATSQDAWSSTRDNSTTCCSEESTHDNSTTYCLAASTLLHETDYDDASQYDSLCPQAATVTSLVLSNFSQPSLAAGPLFSWEHATFGQHSASTPAAARLHATNQTRFEHSRSRQLRNHPYHRLAEEEKVTAVPLRDHSRPVVGRGDLRSISCVSDQGAQSTCEQQKTDEYDDSEWTLGPGNPVFFRPATVAYSAILLGVGP